MEEANSHEHAEDPDYTGGQSTVYRWSKVGTDIIVIGVKNGLRPKVMLRNMRDRNCFANYREPTMIQLYNKITNIKKVLKLTDNLRLMFLTSISKMMWTIQKTPGFLLSLLQRELYPSFQSQTFYKLMPHTD